MRKSTFEQTIRELNRMANEAHDAIASIEDVQKRTAAGTWLNGLREQIQAVQKNSVTVYEELGKKAMPVGLSIRTMKWVARVADQLERGTLRAHAVASGPVAPAPGESMRLRSGRTLTLKSADEEAQHAAR